MGPPRRAERGYAAFETVLVEPAALWARVNGSSSHLRGGGMVEHRIDAAELRNEAAFINDFRDDVHDLGSSSSSRRSANVTVTTCILDGSVHAVISTLVPVAEGRELLLDYGQDYWHGRQDQVGGAETPPLELPPPELGAPTGGAGARRRREEAMRKLEKHQPLDRESVYLHACAANDGFAGWEWLERSNAYEQMRSLCLHEGVDSSPTLLPERIYTEDAPMHIDFPGPVYQQTSTVQRREMLRAIQGWLQRGAKADLVYVGRLLNPAHPAAATNAPSSCAFGLFAREDLPAGTVLCDYQGVRYTSAAGIDPFHPRRLRASAARGTVTTDSIANQDYMLSLATVVSGGAGIASQIRELPDECAPTSAEDARAAWLLLSTKGGDDNEEDQEDAEEETMCMMEREALRREYWLAQLIAFAEAPAALQSALYVAAAAFTRENRAARCDASPSDPRGSKGRPISQAERERAAYVWCVKRDALADVPACVRDLDVEIAQAILALFDKRGVCSTAAATSTRAGDCADTDILLAPEGLQHSCDPNLLLLPPELDSGSAVFVATRDIKQGERLTVHNGGHRALPTPMPPAQAGPSRTVRAVRQTQCVCTQCRAEDRLRAVVCPTCVPPSQRRSGYILPSEVISATVEEDQQQTGYVTPQWQQPMARSSSRSTGHIHDDRADGQNSSSDEDEPGGYWSVEIRHCAGWSCNHFQEHFVPRRGGGGHEQKRWDHHRGVMQRRWLPTSEVDCCRPMREATGGASGAAGRMIRAPPVESPLRGVLAVEVIALKLVQAMQTELDKVVLDMDMDVDSVGEISDRCCRRANVVASVVGRQHWLTNHALALLISRCSVAESHGLFSLYCWITIWLGRSAATAAAHLLPLCNSDTAVGALVEILEAESPVVRRGLADYGLLPADGPSRILNDEHDSGDNDDELDDGQVVPEVLDAPDTASCDIVDPLAIVAPPAVVAHQSDRAEDDDASTAIG